MWGKALRGSITETLGTLFVFKYFFMYIKNMFKFLMWRKKENSNGIKKIAKEELEKNRAVLESLRDYDQGKKEISTTNVKRHLRDIQHSAQ